MKFNKVNWDELFGKMKLGQVVVNCKSEEDSTELLSKLDKLGYKWESGIGLLNRDYYSEYLDETCYVIYSDKTVTYQDIDYFINYGSELWHCGDKVYDLYEYEPLVSGSGASKSRYGVMFEVEKGYSINLSKVISVNYNEDMNNIYFRMDNDDLVEVEDVTLSQYHGIIMYMDKILS